MTVGDTLYCSESGCSKCPVCNGLVRYMSCALPELRGFFCYKCHDTRPSEFLAMRTCREHANANIAVVQANGLSGHLGLNRHSDYCTLNDFCNCLDLMVNVLNTRVSMLVCIFSMCW